MNPWDQDKYIEAWNFATKWHNGQFLPGTELPYINHVANVAMEVMSASAFDNSVEDPDLGLQCALLHDTIEDTKATFEMITENFGDRVARGVLALSKDKSLASKEDQMNDSLSRIRKEPKEVWMVKLGDRITNLQKPPLYWKAKKIHYYRNEAVKILDALGSANSALAERLKLKIDNYKKYCA